ncbi:MAG TPA: hypothetical protein VED37_00435 [Ktedonobacteraceae bacterium]|nr:hypothetical protein [Ktedonobacteraceae bacterium]
MKSHKNPVSLGRNGQEPTTGVSKWRWRPGMNPRFALAVGVVFSFVGLLFILLGLVSLIAGIQDSSSTPIKYPGVITGYTTNIFDNLPHTVIRVEKPGATITIAPAVSHTDAQSLHTGEAVIVYYSQRLDFPYAIESEGHVYLLPGTSSSGNPFGSIALVLLGLIIFPYPAFLASWAWRDLQAQDGIKMTARILALHSSKQNRTPQPGITSPISRPTYSMVLEPVDASFSQDVVAFPIKEEMYHELRPKTLVEITYSPHLHHIYSVKQVNENHSQSAEYD